MTKNKENQDDSKIKALEQEAREWRERLRRQEEDLERLRQEKARLEKSVRDKEAIAASRQH